jgi:hypothetical protein
MNKNDITPTLLHAILKNQHALSDSLAVIANWLEDKGSPLEAYSVRESLLLIEENRTVIGRCIGELMNPA